MSHGYDTFVGIDISKDALDVHGLKDGSPSRFDNTAAGRAMLLSLLPQAGACLSVVEATGGYERDLVAEAVTAGHHIAVVNPRQVRDFAKALGLLAKTDQIDAAVIARFAETTRPVPKGYEERQEQLRELIVRRRQLLDHRTAEKNRAEMAHSSLVRKSVLKHIEMLNKDIQRIEKAILQLVESNDDWRGRFERLKAFPASESRRPPPSWLSCPNSDGSTGSRWRPSWGWLPSTGTAASSGVAVPSGEAGKASAMPSTWLR